MILNYPIILVISDYNLDQLKKLSRINTNL